jgi:GDP-L-fucose synthase
MKILLTGASGFIGSYLFEKLDREHEVFIPSSSHLNLVDTDSVDSYFAMAHLNKENYDFIIHCAAVGRDKPRAFDDTVVMKNVKMMANLLRQKVRMIHFSSGADFGIDIPLLNIKEDQLFNHMPNHSYGMSKNICARLAFSHEWCYNFRLFSVIHDTESSNRLLKRFLSHIKEGKRFVVENDRYVDFIGLNDIYKIVDHTLKYPTRVPKDMNLVYKEKYRISDILNMYCELHNISKDHFRVETPSDIYELYYTGDSELLERTDIKLDGMKRTLENYL